MSSIHKLQLWMHTQPIAGFIVPSTDSFLSEFAPDAEQRLRWLTGYSGSMGIAVVLKQHAALFADGRYFGQAAMECDTIPVHQLGDKFLTPLLDEVFTGWLGANLVAGDRLGFDPDLHPFEQIKALSVVAAEMAIDLIPLQCNPIDGLWEDRPLPVASLVVDYDLSHAGLTREEKRDLVCGDLKNRGIDYYLLSDPEDVAWLLNVRASDLPITPIPLTRACLMSDGQVVWFVDEARISPQLKQSLGGTFKLLPSNAMDELRPILAQKRVAMNLARTTYSVADVATQATAVIDDNCIERMRWKKNRIEVDGARSAHQIDGLVAIRFMAWLDECIAHQNISELDAAAKIRALRDEMPEFVCDSMPTMAAAGPNSSRPHYAPSEATNRNLNDHPIFWLDSGGHFQGGTTDNTLAMAVGVPEPAHIKAHTLVLKGYIAVATARFPKGTRGVQIDALARQFLWRAGLDFSHTTGHGVGSFLSIHERIKIGPKCDLPLEVGMIFSNEPAYYAEGSFGIRIESHLLVVESASPGFLEFQTLSRLPIDPRLVDENALTSTDAKWLADYHSTIWQDYAEKIDSEVAAWLRNIVGFYQNLHQDNMERGMFWA